MNLDSLSFTLSQISYLVANLSKKNIKQSAQELANLVQQHGLEADQHLLRCLFSHVDFSLEGNKTSSGNSKDCLQVQLLIQECGNLLSKTTLVTLICNAVDNPLHQQKTLKPSVNLFSQLRKSLKLTPVQEVLFSLALQHSYNPDLERLASQFFRQKLPELIGSYVDAEGSRQQEGGLHDTTPEVLHLILSRLTCESAYVSADVQSIFWKRLQRDFPREHVPVVLAPVLYPSFPDLPMDKQQDVGLPAAKMETSLANLVPDLGASFTSSIETCKSMIMNLAGGEPTPAVVAHTITAILRSPPVDPKHSTFFEKNDKSGSGSGDHQWNLEVFVQAVKELQPNMKWRDVLMELDNPKFMLKDRNSFLLLFSGIRHMFELFQFPIDVIYRRWNNTDGQYSLILQILKNPDTFSFVDHYHHSVPIDVLKASPDSDNKEIATWRSLDLIEILLYLSERNLYPQVLELFKFPIQHCPDVLMLGLLQHPPPLSVLRQELISLLLPTFLGLHPNSGVILHHAWNTPSLVLSVRPIVMNAMAEWYMRSDNDQVKLSRILDIAQDLKALTLILSSQTFPFVIDLACLASRRGYLKLDKWLTDKIREHGETFISPCAKFLQRRCPQIAGGVKEDAPSKATQLPHETLTTILTCLQHCAPNMSQELSETIVSMITNCNMLLNKSRQPPGVLRHRGLDTNFSAFPSPQQIDPIANLTSNLAGINIVPGMSAGLGSIVSTPGSPSRMIGSSQSPFISGYITAPGIQHTAVAPSGQVVSSVGVGNVGLPRVPAPGVGLEKGGVVTNIFGEPGMMLSKEVEDEANSYFQRIYNHQPLPTLSIEDFLDMLKRFMESSKQRDREVFTCMVKNLMEEYKFFPQYPDKELQVTAQLFGGIIERGLVPTYMVLGLALRFVLEALRKPSGSKMYYFGIAALDRFKNKLKEYQKYCEHVANIPHFTDFPPHLIEYVEYGLQGQEPPNRPTGQVLPAQLAAILQQQQQSIPGTTALKTMTSTTLTTTTSTSKPTTSNSLPARPSIANATNIDTLLLATEKEEKITPPPEALQDKIGFIFNNLSQLNLQCKCDELRDLVFKEHYAWMAQYLVLKRATIEFNFHLLYSNFLDTLKIPDLTKLVLKETYRNIRVLLRSDKGIANFSDRSLLKNLGHWLGMLSLAKNKPILMIDIDLKSLIIEAYAKGQQELLYVIPFVAKVMESCAKSKVFKPKNPWTMAIMNLLAELHREPNLKLNLKFEIEVLCKSLDIDLTKLTPTNLLKDPKKLENLEQQLSKPEEEEAPTPPVPQPSQLPKPSLLPTSEEMQQIVSTSAVPTVTNQPPTSSTPNPVAPSTAEPRFHVMDINVTSVNNLAPHLIINPTLPVFQTHPQLKALVCPAVERAVQEWIVPVMERSIKIACTTAENIVRRDFAVDPDENHIRMAGHTLARCLTGSMAMIACRDHMLASVCSNLKNAFSATLHGASKQQQELVEAAATSIAEANMELACVFIQKAAMEKAVPEIDKRLAEEYEVRKIARSEGRRYCDPAMLTYQVERMNEAIRHTVGGVSNHRFNSVYGECGKTVPGFRPLNDRDSSVYASKPDALPSNSFSGVSFPPDDEITVVLEKIVSDLDIYLQAAINSGLLTATNPRVMALHSLRETAMHARRSLAPNSAVLIVQKTVEGLLEGISSREEPELMLRFREAHLRVLKSFHESRVFGMQWTIKHVTRFLAEAREEIRYNLEAFDLLLRSGLVSIQQYDGYLAQSLENGVNYHALMFAMQLVQTYLIDERMTPLVTEADLQLTVAVLNSIHSISRDAHPGLGSVLEMLRAAQDPTALTDMPSSGPTNYIHSGILQVRSRDFEDGLPEKSEYLLREWVTAYTVNNRDQTKTFNYLVHQMNYHGVLKSDEVVAKFIRISAELCIQNCSRNATDQQARLKCYHTLDAFVRLIYLLFKHTGDGSNVATKLTLLNKTLGLITGLLLLEHESRSNDFNQMPYERLFIMLFLELNQPEAFLEPINFQILTSFCHVFYLIRPTKAPKFAYAWLELISHRAFLTRIMALTSQQKGWPMYAQLLTALFKFLAPFLRNTDLPKPVAVLYRGTLRVLLVLLHDFPEFLCDYHYGFCDVIPSNCIQMRNLILSAFPRNMRLPDPFTPNLKVDILQEIAAPPRIVANVAAMITPPSFRKDLDSYLKQRSPVTFLSDLRSNLQVACEAGMNYNTQLMNALVLYVGSQAIAHIRSKGLSPNMSTIASSAHMDIFQNLGVDLDTEGRYLFLNAIANQLRYPNSHTHYFSCLLLSLFAESNTESIQEQITRVLLERLIVNRPHPWGLLITFIELIKNPAYKFWNHEFVRCAPEIEKLFQSVARSCMVTKQGNQANENDVGEPLAV